MFVLTWFIGGVAVIGLFWLFDVYARACDRL